MSGVDSTSWQCRGCGQTLIGDQAPLCRDCTLLSLRRAASDAAAASQDLSCGLAEQAGVICGLVGAWHDFGYENPPAPACKAIPPLGERSAEAVKAGHKAVEMIDELLRQLYALRQQLVGELRQNQDALMARLDAKYGPLQRPERQS